MSDQSNRTVLMVSAKSHEYEVLIGAGVFSELDISADSVSLPTQGSKRCLRKVL